MALVATGARIEDGDEVVLELRSRPVPARLAELPFVRPGTSASRAEVA
jgi:glycine cleavage system aminomethyltransferase T